MTKQQETQLAKVSVARMINTTILLLESLPDEGLTPQEIDLREDMLDNWAAIKAPLDEVHRDWRNNLLT